MIIEYNKAEVVVMPSLFEGFGLPALEAMACGNALVASRAGAVAEVVGYGADAGGMLVKPGDENELATTISMLLADASLRRKLGEQGRRRAALNFGWDKVGERLEKIYYLELGKRRDRHGG